MDDEAMAPQGNDNHTPNSGSLFPAWPRGGAWTVVCLAVLAVAAPWFNIPRDQADSAGMLAHLHTMFVGADLLYDDEYRVLGMSGLFAFVTQAGVVSNHWPTGATWLQLPGYGLGLAANRVLEWLSLARFNPLGVVPLLAIRAWAIVVLAGIGAGVFGWVHRGLRDWDGDRPGGRWWLAPACVVAAYVWGTPLWYYASESPLRPHLWGSAVVLGFAYLWSRRAVGSPDGRAVTLGALGGLAACVRPQLAVLWLLCAHDAWHAPKAERWRRLVLSTVAFATWPLVHLRVQLWMYGDQLGDYAGPVSHHVPQFLASPYHGALVWCPVLVVAGLAVTRSVVKRERGAVLIALILVGQVWLNAGMRDITPFSVLGTRTWAGGVAFGPRKLVDVLPLMLPAIVSLVSSAKRRGLGGALASVTLALMVPTVALHVASFVDPDRTTGAVHDWEGLFSTLGLSFEGDAMSDSAHARALPVMVGLVVLAVVAVPLLLAAWRTAGGPAVRVRRAGLALVALALCAHVWTTVLLIRSEAMMSEDPQRMQRARAQFNPLHRSLVSRIPAHHAMLRALLGPGAAPAITATELAQPTPPLAPPISRPSREAVPVGTSPHPSDEERTTGSQRRSP